MSIDINSPLGRRQLALKQQQARQSKTLQVPDESDNLDVSMTSEFQASMSDFDNFELPTTPLPKETINKIESLTASNLQKMKKEAEDKHQLPLNVRSRLDILLKLKKNTKVIKIDDISFTLKTLTQNEYKDIWDDLLKDPPANQVSLSIEVKVRILAKAITHIDGQEAALVLGTSDFSEMVAIYKEFQSEVIDLLDKEYKALKDPEEIKPEEVQQVSEQIKK
jgi:hypothetical protein